MQRAVQALFSLEHSPASNDDVEGSRLQHISYGYAALKREESFISKNTCFPPVFPFAAGLQLTCFIAITLLNIFMKCLNCEKCTKS